MAKEMTVLGEIERIAKNPRRYRFWLWHLNLFTQRRIAALLMWLLRRPWVYEQAELAAIEATAREQTARANALHRGMEQAQAAVNGETFNSWQRLVRDIEAAKAARWN